MTGSHPSAFSLLSVDSQSQTFEPVCARSAACAVSLTACAATVRLRLCAASRLAPCQVAERASRTGERLGGSVRWYGVGDRGARRRWKRPFDFPILHAESNPRE